ncbi:MAG: SGNH/GDSL hydrolase family protein [Bacteroidales bacterium]|nr:SGNH/GDSL hydrolase family protein [Bacteroidales bacterium]
MFLSRFLWPALLLVGMPVVSSAADPFLLQNGDRVVLIGSTLIEREQKSGYWELALTQKNAGKSISFRNLGWSGDTVHAEARGRFDYANEAKRLDQLISLTKELKPTVIVICYGQNESFAGKDGVPSFTKGLEKLLDLLQPTQARIVLMSPTRFGAVLAPARNATLSLYRDALQAVAQQRKLAFVDLFTLVPEPRTENGIHLTPEGYRESAALLSGTAPRESEELRQAIIAKNRLFFHRWRPQNETYLFGFRKHEQGRNAVEVAQFDPLVAQAEKQIQTLAAKSQ